MRGSQRAVSLQLRFIKHKCQYGDAKIDRSDALQVAGYGRGFANQRSDDFCGSIRLAGQVECRWVRLPMGELRIRNETPVPNRCAAAEASPAEAVPALTSAGEYVARISALNQNAPGVNAVVGLNPDAMPASLPGSDAQTILRWRPVPRFVRQAIA
jgi:hypothetical protein